MNEESGKDSFKSFVDVNRKGKFSAVDYLHLIAKLKAVPADFIIKLMEIVWPKFIERDGSVFVEPLFDEGKYRQMRARGDADAEIEYWINQFWFLQFLNRSLTRKLWMPPS